MLECAIKNDVSGFNPIFSALLAKSDLKCCLLKLKLAPNLMKIMKIEHEIVKKIILSIVNLL